MKKITKQNLLGEKAELNFKTIVEAIFFVICMGFVFWLRIDNKVIFFIVFAVFLFIMLSICILDIIITRKTKHLPSPYYIVEDVFIHVFEKERVSIKHANTILYTLKFSKSGEYTYWALKRWKNKEKDDEKYSAIFFSNPGDKFYLVVSKSDGKIFNCYNQKYYSLCEEDFDYIDGKYYPKK